MNLPTSKLNLDFVLKTCEQNFVKSVTLTRANKCICPCPYPKKQIEQTQREEAEQLNSCSLSTVLVLAQHRTGWAESVTCWTAHRGNQHKQRSCLHTRSVVITARITDHNHYLLHWLTIFCGLVGPARYHRLETWSRLLISRIFVGNINPEQRVGYRKNDFHLARHTSWAMSLIDFKGIRNNWNLNQA